MATGMREFRAWQEAVATAGEVARAARKASRGETRPLTDLLVRSSAELAIAIARAHAKTELVEQHRAFQAAREAAAALETGLAIARHAELLPLATCGELFALPGAADQRRLAGRRRDQNRELMAVGRLRIACGCRRLKWRACFVLVPARSDR
jgi:23S rRNA-intervening sequence protein